MADHDTDRPGSRGYHASPAPPSPRPSVASRASKSSLRREQLRQDSPIHPRPSSVAYSRPHTPQTTTAPVEEHPPPHPSASPPQPAQPPFAPLFTLITSTQHASTRQTTHHPTVHYIFADDDPEILTAALAHHHRGGIDDDNPAEADDDPSSNNHPLDRALLLDMDPTPDGSGLQVSWASSLTPDWAVTSASLSQMEGGSASSAPPNSSNLVLKIEGVSIEPSPGGHLQGQGQGKGKDRGKRTGSASFEAELHSSSGGGGSAGRHSPPPGADEYAGLLQDFEKRMATLRRVVEAGEARQRALEEGEEEPTQVPEGTAVGGASRADVAGDDAQ